MRRTLPYLAAALIVGATGVVQGIRTDRWTISHELRNAVARINQVPMSFGEWAGRPADLDPRELEAANIAGGSLRRYQNRRDGRTLTALLVCGRPGPISVHTPDICYTGAGYALRDSPVSSPVAYGNPPRTAETWRGDFVRQGPVAASCLRIFWSWSPGGGWTTPENPRLTFARHGVLYKLYVICETGDQTAKVEDDPVADFLRNFLPEVDRGLGSPAG